MTVPASPIRFDNVRQSLVLPRNLFGPFGIFLTAAMLLGLLPAVAHAQVWMDKSAVLKDFFAKSDIVRSKRLALTPVQVAAVKQRLGYAPAVEWTVYYGLTKDKAGGPDKIDGLAVIDNELGQHQPITFAALVGADGTMRRLEVMVYREAYGDAIRENRFRQQFQGKTARDPVRHGHDIVAVAGATISSRSMATGARRALIVLDELVIRPGIARALTPAKVAVGASGVQ